jgi:SAM-dependent methyltransferase
MTWYETRGSDEQLVSSYSAYQQRYATEVRASDRVLIELIAARADGRRGLSLLDIGCSTGNFLRHLRAALPGLGLTGGDVVPSVVAACRENPDLAGIDFEVVDITDFAGEHDFVVANAILFLLDDDELDRAAASAAAALRPGGAFLVFDWFHPFEQELDLVERSAVNPDGLRLRIRSYSLARRILERHGLTGVRFQPFSMPFDLSRPADPGDITSFTQLTSAGERLSFRGTLFQPWCHVVAEKP